MKKLSAQCLKLGELSLKNEIKLLTMYPGLKFYKNLAIESLNITKKALKTKNPLDIIDALENIRYTLMAIIEDADVNETGKIIYKPLIDKINTIIGGLNESKIVKKSKLKPLVKAILREMYKKQLNEWTSGTVDDYEIEFDTLVIPGITNETDSVMATINIDYEGHPGEKARGMFGPPEHSSPAESPEVSILDWDIVLLTITPEQGQPTEIDDFRKWTPEQYGILKKAVNDYMESNDGKIKDQIFDKLGDIEPDEPDHEDDYFDDR